MGIRSLPSGDPGKLSCYKAGESKDRFRGRIFYVLMLDTCEDIYEKSFSLFSDFVEKQLFIE
ncbi:MAG: hypothetical protein ACOYXB_06560 [Bacteroidota bacterium]